MSPDTTSNLAFSFEESPPTAQVGLNSSTHSDPNLFCRHSQRDCDYGEEMLSRCGGLSVHCDSKEAPEDAGVVFSCLHLVFATAVWPCCSSPAHH
ncbi:hypothetical protein PR002_g20065 [Phytophthora rubi]|uniref:Uncharacterized protein n=1 Tax=Phytophthora rubi TaxID=129364 RepID=A0A6A3JKI4_9STRA|nr:hypothetical protein PR002_g20065 [Phytophthora rubi]